jgi:hypothetical protein
VAGRSEDAWTREGEAWPLGTGPRGAKPAIGAGPASSRACLVGVAVMGGAWLLWAGPAAGYGAGRGPPPSGMSGVPPNPEPRGGAAKMF